MPRKTVKDINTEPCEVCGAVIRYKADVPRHRRLHLTNKTAMTYKCTFKGCTYQNLQKSNLNTHISTHTGEKPHACPDCEFRTADPGSLIRHRKRTHNYVPKNNRVKAKPVGTKQSRRHAPYKRQASEESLSTLSSSSSEEIPDGLLDFSTLLASVTPACRPLDTTCDAPRDNQYSYTWDKDLFHTEEPCASLNLESYTPSKSGPIPPHIYPAAGACHQLENFHEYTFDFLDSFLNQYTPSTVPAATQLDCLSISAADSWITHPETPSFPDPQWAAANSSIPEFPVRPPADFNCDVSSTDGFFYGSPSTSFSFCSPSDFPPLDSPSPSRSCSAPSPSDFFFADSPSAGLLFSPDSLEFVFPNPILVC